MPGTNKFYVYDMPGTRAYVLWIKRQGMPLEKSAGYLPSVRLYGRWHSEHCNSVKHMWRISPTIQYCFVF